MTHNPFIWYEAIAEICVKATTYGEAMMSERDEWVEAFDCIIDCDSLLELAPAIQWPRLYKVLSRHCKKYTAAIYGPFFSPVNPLRKQDDLRLISEPKLPYPDSSFDAVVAADFFTHILDSDVFLSFVSEVKRVLKTGGQLYLLESMIGGVFLHQPHPYKRIRPRKMYERLFQPEIKLEDRGGPSWLYHFLLGDKVELEIDESQVAIDVGSGRNKIYGTISVDRRIVFSYGRRLTDIIADAHHLPFKEVSVDELWACNLIEHYKNPYPLLIEFCRVLKDTGSAVFEVPYPGTASSDGDSDHKLVTSPDRWAKIFSGFFEKMMVIPMGYRFRGSDDKWIEWQKKLIKLGFYSMAQGGQFRCSVPRVYPIFNYVPWWLEEWVKNAAGDDLV